MSSSPPNPHDALFRRVLTDPANVIGELRAVLPAPVTARIDWTRLQVQPGSFVSAELRSRYSDVLYRTRLHPHPDSSAAAPAPDAYIYLLVEHQSSNDSLMAMRMLEYVVGIWNQHLRQHPGTSLLPAVVPVVVHSTHTGRRWSAPTEIGELIDLHGPARDALAPYLPRFRYLLDDLTTIDLTALRARELTPATLVMLVLHKIAPGNPRLDTDLLEVVEELRAVGAGPDLGDLRAVFTYILAVAHTDTDLDPVIERLGPRAKEAIVTLAEKLEARGRAEGEARGRADTLIEQLTLKFGPLPPALTATIRDADPARLRDWTGRVLTADTLEEIVDH